MSLEPSDKFEPQRTWRTRIRNDNARDAYAEEFANCGNWTDTTSSGVILSLAVVCRGDWVPVT